MGREKEEKIKYEIVSRIFSSSIFIGKTTCLGKTRENFPKIILSTVNFIYRKHKNQLKLLIMSKKIDLNCLICGYQSKTHAEWELHVTSEQHIENYRRYKKVPSPENHIQPITQENSAPQATSTVIPPLLPPKELIELTAKFHERLNQKALKQIVAKERKEWNCVHCNVTCQSICSWEAHLASHKHRKNKHKFHTYPGISKEFVKRKYQNSFVRAAETIGKLISHVICSPFE